MIKISDEAAKLTAGMLEERCDGSRRPGDLQERHGLPVAVLRALNDADCEREVGPPVRTVRKDRAVAITPAALQVSRYPLVTGSQEEQNPTYRGHDYRYTHDPGATPHGESSRRGHKLVDKP